MQPTFSTLATILVVVALLFLCPGCQGADQAGDNGQPASVTINQAPTFIDARGAVDSAPLVDSSAWGSQADESRRDQAQTSTPTNTVEAAVDATLTPDGTP